MKKLLSWRIFAVIAVLTLGAFVLASCGSGGGGSSGGGPAATGSVAVLLTDNPSDGLSAVIVTITKIQLLSNEGRVTIFDGVKVVDLLDLDNETVLLTLDETVPAGWYNKIRLFISDVDLLDNDGQPVIKDVKLPSGRIDLNPRGPFFVAPEGMLTAKLDMDVAKSLKITENPRKYVFRPVVFVDIIDGIPLTEGFVRVAGTVESIDDENDTFVLCLDNDDLVADDDGPCITVEVTEDTAIFSSEDDGEPVSFDALEVGDKVTAIGMLIITNGTENVNGGMTLGLSAVVVEIGEFLKLSGTIRSGVDTGTGLFDFEPDVGQGISATLLTVELQEETGIFLGDGTALTDAAIANGVRAEVDGILLLDPEPDVLNAAFILIGGALPPPDKISGELANIIPATRSLDLITDTGTVCVNVPGDAILLRVEQIGEGDYSSSFITFGDLEEGQQADLHGEFDGGSGCFVPETVVVFVING